MAKKISKKERKMRELHKNYLAFMRILCRSQTPPIKLELRGFDDFCEHWQTLDAKTRRRCTYDYKLGYDETVRRSIKEVARLIRKGARAG